MNEIIKLEGEIDLTKNPCETRIKRNTNNVWQDFGFWLEATGFMAFQAMKIKGWNPTEMSLYVAEYINKCLNDYKIKK